jgi:hypothetical protein
MIRLGFLSQYPRFCSAKRVLLLSLLFVSVVPEAQLEGGGREACGFVFAGSDPQHPAAVTVREPMSIPATWHAGHAEVRR